MKSDVNTDLFFFFNEKNVESTDLFLVRWGGFVHTMWCVL